MDAGDGHKKTIDAVSRQRNKWTFFQES